MDVNDFDYFLPEELIAQKPVNPRDHSRLMVINRNNHEIQHKHFYDIIDYLQAGDVLVINNTKVLPARLFGIKDETNAKIEVVLLKRINLTDWEALVRPGKRIKKGTSIKFGNGELKAEALDDTEVGGKVLRFQYEGVFEDILEKLGQMPLPHYIKEQLEDKNRYQTVYAENNGSAAAPTAGLHFTKELLKKIEAKGIEICDVLLHVGLGTFRPVKVDKIEEHQMHSEYYEISQASAQVLNKAWEEKRRIIAVGTTSVRTLETVMNKHGKIIPDKGWTDIFIYPGYEFKIVNGLLTNFHLPKSTLIMLVSSLLGHKETMEAYKLAVENQYRFFSFGDAMLVL